MFSRISYLPSFVEWHFAPFSFCLYFAYRFSKLPVKKWFGTIIYNWKCAEMSVFATAFLCVVIYNLIQMSNSKTYQPNQVNSHHRSVDGATWTEGKCLYFWNLFLCSNIFDWLKKSMNWNFIEKKLEFFWFYLILNYSSVLLQYSNLTHSSAEYKIQIWNLRHWLHCCIEVKQKK